MSGVAVTANSSGLELYVYYKLKPAQADAARHTFEKVCLGQTEVQVDLRQREDAEEALLTWMEIYRGPEVAMLSLQSRLAAALAPFIEGQRHLERFRPLPPL